MNKSSPQPDNDLKAGDRVKLVRGTLAWKAEMTLRGRTGEVIECRDDGRASIRFDNRRVLMGRPAQQFERVVETRAESKEVRQAKFRTKERSVDKQKKTATELEEIVKQRIGAGDFEVTGHTNPETGWHAMIYGRQPAEVHRCQVMAESIVVELCQHYDLAE
jgi:hypothetical protein